MKYCKCGEKLVFKGGYVIASTRVNTYECYSCNKCYEQIETKKLIEVNNEKI